MKYFRQVILLLTKKCNLHCSYCYVTGNNENPGNVGIDPITKETIDESIRYLNRSASVLQISGGEPLLFPGLFFYTVKKVRNLRPGTRIKLKTNGTLIDDSIASFVKKNHIDVSVSLDSIPEINDRIRGGSKETLKGILKLKEYGIKVNLTAVITVENIPYLDKFVAMSVLLENIGSISFDLLRKPAGREDVYRALMPDIGQFRESFSKAYNAMERARFFKPDIVLNDVLIASLRNRVPSNKGIYYCWSAMGESITVTPEGGVFSCPSLIYDRSAFLGDISKRQLIDKKKSRSVEELEECITCGARYICRGGCPSRAYLEGGGRLGISEFECAYRKYICENYAGRDFKSRSLTGIKSPQASTAV